MSTERDVLLKAASLCRLAANALDHERTITKSASEAADLLVSKGIIGTDQKSDYVDMLVENPEKIAAFMETAKELPHRDGAIGEAYGSDAASAADPFDKLVGMTC